MHTNNLQKIYITIDQYLIKNKITIEREIIHIIILFIKSSKYHKLIKNKGTIAYNGPIIVPKEYYIIIPCTSSDINIYENNNIKNQLAKLNNSDSIHIDQDIDIDRKFILRITGYKNIPVTMIGDDGFGLWLQIMLGTLYCWHIIIF